VSDRFTRVTQKPPHAGLGQSRGAGGLFLFVAWLQRGGDSLDARPWLAIGLALAVAGIAGHARRG